MRFTVLTIFPQMFTGLEESMIKRAQEAELIDIKLIDFRDYAESKHKNVDDVPYGGGAGMVLKPEPIYRAVHDLECPQGKRKTVLLTPQGSVFNQKKALELADYNELVLLCGHYEGFDERIRFLADEEISIGDYVITGGELAAMVIIDAVARLVPGVLGKKSSAEQDSHSQGLLEYPQYTRPSEYEGLSVPEILLSGHHGYIQKWRRKESLRRTFLRRPDLFQRVEFLTEDYLLLEELALENAAIADQRQRWEHLKPLPRKNRRNKKNPREMMSE